MAEAVLSLPVRTRYRSRASSQQRAEALAGWLLATPATVLIWLMLLGPAVAVIVLSLTDWLFGETTLPGSDLSNYAELWSDPVFWTSRCATRSLMSHSQCRSRYSSGLVSRY